MYESVRLWKDIDIRDLQKEFDVLEERTCDFLERATDGAISVERMVIGSKLLLEEFCALVRQNSVAFSSDMNSELGTPKIIRNIVEGVRFYIGFITVAKELASVRQQSEELEQQWPLH